MLYGRERKPLGNMKAAEKEKRFAEFQDDTSI